MTGLTVVTYLEAIYQCWLLRVPIVDLTLANARRKWACKAAGQT